MKQVVVFENDGVIDVRSMKTFGVSVKESTNPIGYFGTGLKYAIAILLRHGQQVKVEANNETFRFGLKPIEIRGKAFDVVTMNDEEMPFTTELGKNWEMWQAFREVYCNCIDENGSVSLQDNELDWNVDTTGKTRVTISGAESVVTYHDRDSIVLRIPASLRIADGKVEIFDKPSRFVYYRGVRVWKLPEPTLFTYNIIEESELTEDRTIKNTALAIAKLMGSIATLKNVDAIKRVITEKDHYENRFEFMAIDYWGFDPSEEFERTVGREFELNNDRLNASVRMWYKNKKNKESIKSYEVDRLNDVEQKQLNKCINICNQSFRDFKQYDVLIVKTLGDATMAIAEIDQGRMVISKRAFELGTKFLLSTIIEEFMHLKTGFGDCSRELQTSIFDAICTLIEDHVIKEPV